MRKRRKYIGVTGFIHRAQVAAVHRGSVIGIRPKAPLLMVGVLASSKTLLGETLKRSPKAENISSLFYQSEDLLRIVHYHSRERGEKLLEELLFARECGGVHCDGLQLNMALPSMEVLREYLEKFPDDSIILQANNETFEQAEDHPLRLANLVKPYFHEGLATHVLLDRSGGKGLPLKVGETMDYVDALAQAGITDGVGVAGGLCGMNTYRLAPLYDKFPYLSADAEDAIHSGAAKDIFVCDRAIKWVNEAIKLRKELVS